MSILGWRPIASQLRPLYGDVLAGKPIAFIDSSNHIELCVNGGNAQKKFRAKTGDKLVVS